MEEDLDRGDKAAPAMSLLGPRMLLTAPDSPWIIPLPVLCPESVYPGVVPDCGHERERKQGCSTSKCFPACVFSHFRGFLCVW